MEAIGNMLYLISIAFITAINLVAVSKLLKKPANNDLLEIIEEQREKIEGLEAAYALLVKNSNVTETANSDIGRREDNGQINSRKREEALQREIDRLKSKLYHMEKAPKYMETIPPCTTSTANN